MNNDNSIPFEDDLVEILLRRFQVHLTCAPVEVGGEKLRINALLYDSKTGKMSNWGKGSTLEIIVTQPISTPRGMIRGRND